MTIAPNLTVVLGTAGASTVISATPTGDPSDWLWTYVTLSENYAQVNPPGWIIGTPGMENGTPNSNRGNYTSGQRALFWAVEAAALVAASAGVYS